MSSRQEVSNTVLDEEAGERPKKRRTPSKKKNPPPSIGEFMQDLNEEPTEIAEDSLANVASLHPELLQERVNEDSTEMSDREEYAEDSYYEMDDNGDEYVEGDSNAELSEDEIFLNPNQVLLTLSYSLMNQVRQCARMEGVTPDDILIELIAEGVTRRAFMDAQRPQPNHLTTRTGYVPPEANGGGVPQPQLSHHGQYQNGNNGNGGGNGGGNGRWQNGNGGRWGGQNGKGNNNGQSGNRFNGRNNGGSNGGRNSGGARGNSFRNGSRSGGPVGPVRDRDQKR